MILVPLLNPKFATGRATDICELRVRGTGRLQPNRPQVSVADVLQRHRHDLARAVDGDVAEELQAETGREIFALRAAAAVLIAGLRAERVVERPRAPGSGMQ